MTTCARCGQPLTPQAGFCAACGYPVASVADRADWAGALLANGIALAAMIVLAAVPAFSTPADPATGFTAPTTLASIFLSIALAAGGSASLQAGIFGFDLTYRPLTITLVGYALLVWIVVGRLRRGGTPPTAAGFTRQALRVGAVHTLVLAAVALLSRIGGVPSSDVPENLAEVPLTMTADVGSTVTAGLVTLAVALFAATVVGLPGVFPSFERTRAAIAGPVRSLFLLGIAACVATTVGIGVLIAVLGPRAVQDSLPVQVPVAPDMAAGELALGILGLLIVAPNLAGYALLFAMGVPVQISGTPIGVGLTGAGQPASAHILEAAGKHSWLWIGPAGVLVLLVVTGWYAARRSELEAPGRWAGAVLGIVLPVALLLVAVSVGIEATLGGFGGSVSFNLAAVVLLGAGYGVLFGLLGTVLRRVPRRRLTGEIPAEQRESHR